MTPNNVIKRIGIRRPLMARGASSHAGCSRRRPAYRQAGGEEKRKRDERDPLDSWEEEEMRHPSLM